MNEMVSAVKAAAMLGVDPSSLRRWVRAGLVTADLTTAGGHYRFDVDRLRVQLAALSA